MKHTPETALATSQENKTHYLEFFALYDEAAKALAVAGIAIKIVPGPKGQPCFTFSPGWIEIRQQVSGSDTERVLKHQL